jgi:hypothetical protein
MGPWGYDVHNIMDCPNPLSVLTIRVWRRRTLPFLTVLFFRFFFFLRIFFMTRSYTL